MNADRSGDDGRRLGDFTTQACLDHAEQRTQQSPDEYIDERRVLVSLERELLLRWHATLIDGQEPDLLFGQGEVRPPVAHRAAR